MFSLILFLSFLVQRNLVDLRAVECTEPVKQINSCEWVDIYSAQTAKKIIKARIKKTSLARSNNVLHVAMLNDL